MKLNRLRHHHFNYQGKTTIKSSNRLISKYKISKCLKCLFGLFGLNQRDAILYLTINRNVKF